MNKIEHGNLLEYILEEILILGEIDHKNIIKLI